MKITLGMKVSWMGFNWIVTKVGETCCSLVDPVNPLITGLAFRSEMGPPVVLGE